MRRAPVHLALALIVTALPAAADELWPAVSKRAAHAPLQHAWVPYRCSAGPVRNAYRGALYSEPQAIHRGYAYRPYYRYTAYRLIPRTYLCAE
ncbi:hypothetical protein AS156_39765 [Bradyrhizobium macuxiense]|uniref:Uncharacterized protein n=1 Tax=Bradyrhizobium macuxiense TaxID=1755647 RepID=A0A109JYG7_9BRAD|nr:hypothetical protein [Bradyrhizobium macuxiense]KWV57443.1 hypothetical protein AS156_39765 [Bradyrhizobium macuxiense]